MLSCLHRGAFKIIIFLRYVSNTFLFTIVNKKWINSRFNKLRHCIKRTTIVFYNKHKKIIYKYVKEVKWKSIRNYRQWKWIKYIHLVWEMGKFILYCWNTSFLISRIYEITKTHTQHWGKGSKSIKRQQKREVQIF